MHNECVVFYLLRTIFSALQNDTFLSVLVKTVLQPNLTCARLFCGGFSPLRCTELPLRYDDVVDDINVEEITREKETAVAKDRTVCTTRMRA